VSSEIVKIADNTIDLNSNFESGTPTENSGIRIIRGDELPVQFRWNEANDNWEFTNDGTNFRYIASLSTESYANGAFSAANSASSYANGSFLAANTADQKAVSAGSYANSAYAQGNTSYIHANAAYNLANTLVSTAIDAYARPHVNAAFSLANTNATNITITGSMQIQHILRPILPRQMPHKPTSVQ
jgi:hypothetical protein